MENPSTKENFSKLEKKTGMKETFNSVKEGILSNRSKMLAILGFGTLLIALPLASECHSPFESLMLTFTQTAGLLAVLFFYVSLLDDLNPFSSKKV